MELAIGVPLYGYSIPSMAGMAAVYYYTNEGAQFLYLNDLNSGALEPEENDQFGYALAILDEPHYRKFTYLPIGIK